LRIGEDAKDWMKCRTTNNRNLPEIPLNFPTLSRKKKKGEKWHSKHRNSKLIQKQDKKGPLQLLITSSISVDQIYFGGFLPDSLYK
jgi:hypothetical protein